MSAIAFTAEFVLGKIIDAFGQNVVVRWSRRRAEEFVATFCNVLMRGEDEASLARLLDEVFADEQRSQALFEAYRRVALSASPKLGPRIIAAVMGRVIAECRESTDVEQRLLAAAEILSDSELLGAAEYFQEFGRSFKRVGASFFDQGEPEDTGGMDFWSDWGSWLGKLGNLGFVSHSVRLVAIYDHPRHPNAKIEDYKIATDMRLDDAFAELARLVKWANDLG